MPPLGLAKGGHKFFKGGNAPPRGGREVPCSELVELYLLIKVSKIIDNAHLGLYRDNGLALITNCNDQKLDRIRKKLNKNFKDEGLKTTVELCDENVDFLDISLKCK